MAYTKRTWTNGEVITADKLNNIENGVANLDTGKANKINYKTATSNSPLELNDCTDLYTHYEWDFEGSKYVTCGGSPISTSAGSMFNILNLGGRTQIFIHYNSPEIIKMRVLYNGTWSNWYRVNMASSTL